MPAATAKPAVSSFLPSESRWEASAALPQPNTGVNGMRTIGSSGSTDVVVFEHGKAEALSEMAEFEKAKVQVHGTSTSSAAAAAAASAGRKKAPLPLCSLNHVSVHCADVRASLYFYQDVLGFIPVRRPDCLNFDGAWLFNHGIGIHLIGAEDCHADVDHGASPGKKDDAMPRHAPASMHQRKPINPKADHVSFTCDDIAAVEQGLQAHGIEFVRQCVEDGGILVDQLFFHDPDGHMIEVCNCNLLPIVPLGPSCSISPSLRSCQPNLAASLPSTRV